VSERPAASLSSGVEWGGVLRSLESWVIEKSFELSPKTDVHGLDTLIRMAIGRGFQIVEAAAAKLREPKHVGNGHGEQNMSFS